ncbi:unnamed protein product [Ascophyllum nodosum]
MAGLAPILCCIIGMALALALVMPSTVAFVASSSLLNTRSNSCWHGVDQSRSSRSSFPLCMMAEKKNRKARRLADGQKRKSTSSKSPRQPARSASDTKWLQVLDVASSIEAGSVKVVSAKYKGEDKFFALATYGGKYFAVSEGCGRCKFPMINGKVKVLVGNGKVEDIKEGEMQDPEASVAAVCPLCGAIFDMTTGLIAGEQPKGLLPSLVSKLVSQTAAEKVTPYQAQALSTGALVVRVD